jgi:EF hand
MTKFLSTSILALLLTVGSQAFAQTPSPSAAPGGAPPASTAPVQMDPAAEAKFKAADPKGTGFIEGAALKPFEPMLKEIDTDGDGRISRAEFASAVKAGIVK